jgi:hypothetical protein
MLVGFPTRLLNQKKEINNFSVGGGLLYAFILLLGQHKNKYILIIHCIEHQAKNQQPSVLAKRLSQPLSCTA